MKPIVNDIRPTDDGGAWIRIIYDIPAQFDHSKTESIDMQIFLESVVGLTVSGIVEKAVAHAQSIIVGVAKTGGL